MKKWEIIDELESKLAELDAEMEALGVEDATAWERFDEYEEALYLLAEYHLGWHDPAETEAAEWDNLIEFVDIAEEAALSELAAFGHVEYEDGISDDEFGEDDYEPFWDFACDLFDYYDGHWHESYVLDSLY